MQDGRHDETDRRRTVVSQRDIEIDTIDNEYNDISSSYDHSSSYFSQIFFTFHLFVKVVDFGAVNFGTADFGATDFGAADDDLPIGHRLLRIVSYS